MIYRPIDLTKEQEQALMMMMMMRYRELVSSQQNSLHQTEWPLGIIEKKDMDVQYIGAFDHTPDVGVGLAGMIGYTTVYFETGAVRESRGLSVRGGSASGMTTAAHNDNFAKPLAIFKIMMFVREEYRGKGIGSGLWRELVWFAHDQGLPLWIGNNTKGGDASLKKAVGEKNVQVHSLTVVPYKVNSKFQINPK